MECRKIHAFLEINAVNILASAEVKSTGKLSFSKIYGFCRLIFKIIKNLLFRRPNICYLALSATRIALYRDFIFVSLIKLFNVPIVFHLHNKGVSKHGKNWINQLIYKFIFNKSEVILLSKHLYNDIEKYVQKDKIHICPNGVPDVNIFPVVKVKPTLLFLSNYIRSKGVLDLIEATQILESRGVKFQVNLVGSDADITRGELEEIISKKGLRSKLYVMGPQYGNSKIDEFANASIFVLPTYYGNECFPLVLLEAMQAQIPIISTFEGGIPDIVEDGVTGFLVPQQDIVALADRMEQLILNPDLCQQMGAAGRKRYEELFTAEIFENRITEILQEVSLKYT
jgi:glycosyltransferase involved in cell wall biosynthesis